MKYLLLVSHATLAEGLEGALTMLLGDRPFVIACGMHDGTSASDYRDQLAREIAAITPADEVVLLGDISGGSPLKNALAMLDAKGLGDNVMVFGGANLAMAISAVMGIDDGLDMDAIRDAMLMDGSQAVKQV
ncbi:MAG: PTS fructose transporter subunit IIA [Coriobacteriales bacterium]|nr:PTS fructose transporter subunit IIA [Coriobacteriales bacterium]